MKMGYEKYTRTVYLKRINKGEEVPLTFSPSHEYPLCMWCKHHNSIKNQCAKFNVHLTGIDSANEYCLIGYENGDD